MLGRRVALISKVDRSGKILCGPMSIKHKVARCRAFTFHL